MASVRVVGRAGFEPATNGLKGRYALSARCRFPLCAKRMDRTDGQFSHPFCRNLPTLHTPLMAQRVSLWRMGWKVKSYADCDAATAAPSPS
jgi:hypothetical protein